MRTLSNTEKDTISHICKKQRTSIVFILSDNIDGLVLSIDRDSSSVKYMNKVGNNNSRKNLQTTITLLSFIKLLEDEGYIYTSHMSHGRTVVGNFGQVEALKEFNSNPKGFYGWEIPEEEIKELILKYLDRVIFPTTSLHMLLHNNFQTIEGLRFKKNQRLTILAITLSFIIGLLGIFKDYFFNC